MEQTETLIEVEEKIEVADPEVLLPVHPPKETGTFNVFRRADFPSNTVAIHNRHDFYKISLIRGTGVLHYADRNIEIDRDALIFSNPNVPYAWEINSKDPAGYFCVFTEEFFSRRNRLEFLQESELFRTGGNPVAFPEDHEVHRISKIFRTMRKEMGTDYEHKYDLQHSYVMLLAHEAQKIQAANANYRHGSAAARQATRFTDLLERQFPIDSPQHIFQMRTANDYAAKLDIHVNHLNRVVKETTGKTTTDHITARVILEAITLLKKTTWSVSEIANSLGFEYPAYFNTFFKKQTGLTPGSFR